MTLNHLNNRYRQRFEALRRYNHKAFIPFTVLGWPNRDTSLEIVQAMLDGGATMLELGLAFSDPAADGPIIQAADLETLQSGFQVDDALTLIRDIRQRDVAIPIGLLVYYNMVLARGVEAFFRDIHEAGADSVLIADLPAELADEVYPAAKRYGVALVFIVSTLTTDVRLEQILQRADGFLYVVSRLGITGTEAHYDTALEDLLQRVKKQTDLPLCVGFGISTPEQAADMIRKGADGVISGSKIIQLVKEQQAIGKCDNLTWPVRAYVSVMSENVNLALSLQQ